MSSKNLKTVFGALVAGGALAFSGASLAAAKLELSSGATTITVEDGGVGDANSVAGAITFIGSVGIFNINVSTGLTKPAIGSLGSPDMDLNSVDSNTAGGTGTLTIRFTDTDFISDGSNLNLETNVGGTTEGTAAFAVYVDSGNAEFGTMGPSATQVFSGGPFSGGAFAASGSQVVNINGSFSLTQVATITHSGQATSSFDIQTNVPEPATVALLGAGLLGIGAATRRRKTKNV